MSGVQIFLFFSLARSGNKNFWKKVQTLTFKCVVLMLTAQLILHIVFKTYSINFRAILVLIIELVSHSNLLSGFWKWNTPSLIYNSYIREGCLIFKLRWKRRSVKPNAWIICFSVIKEYDGFHTSNIRFLFFLFMKGTYTVYSLYVTLLKYDQGEKKNIYCIPIM